jgi:predicted ATP-grasp superfamily ATP-dependent carboligase
MTDRTVSVLLLASRFGMPYRALRSIHAAGARVFVLGNSAARGLRRSRFCSGFAETSIAIDGTRSEKLAAAIDQAAQQFGIDVAIAGDAPATRSLIAAEALLRTRVFPMPQLADFDLLNNKWAFSQLCQSRHVRYPQTWLFSSQAELAAFVRDRNDDRLYIAKPLSMDSSKGVVRIDRSTLDTSSARLNYEPILLQEFIDGADIGASVFSNAGSIEAFIAHYYSRGRYTPISDASIRSDIASLLGPLRTSGIFNFDMRRTAEGQIYYLECNPRVFWKISMSMLAGVNFVAQGLSALGLAPAPIQSEAPSVALFPKALLLEAATAPWKLSPSSLRTVKFLYADPVPYFSEMMGIERDPSG